MIRIFAYRKGGCFRFYATGHAEYHPGEDVVCAGVSALTGALISYAASCADCRHLRWHCASGEAFLSCRGLARSVSDAILLGLSQIAAVYPEHVCVESDTERKNKHGSE